MPIQIGAKAGFHIIGGTTVSSTSLAGIVHPAGHCYFKFDGGTFHNLRELQERKGVFGTSYPARRAALAAQQNTISLPVSGAIKERKEIATQGTRFGGFDAFGVGVSS